MRTWGTGILATILLVLVTGILAGVAGYQLGLSEGLARTAAEAGSAVVGYPYHWGWGGFGFGFGFFGILLTILFFFLLIRVAFGFGRGWRGGPPMMGRGPWGPGSADPRSAWIEDWHRRLHEDEGRTHDSADTSR